MKVLVLGAAVSGRAASALLSKHGIEHVVYDRQSQAGHGWDDSPAVFRSGPWDPEMLEGIDRVVASPGFSPASAPLQSAHRAGVEVWSEVELALQYLNCPIVAVTGTNGKTTVVEQIAVMLNEAGIKAVLAGNSGRAASDAALHSWDVAVLEVSSFQLEYIHSLKARVAVLLNVAADHYDWHGCADAYRSAKAKLLASRTDTDLLIYDQDDPGVQPLVARARGRKVAVSGQAAGKNAWGVVGDRFCFPGGDLALDEIPTRQPAFLVDLAAASVAAHEMGSDCASIIRVIGRFRPGAHRRQKVGVWNGVAWVNDSKATNPAAAAAAVASYSSVVLIAGGQNKGLDLTPLASAPNVRQLIAIGQSADELVSLSRSGEVAPTLAEAIETAARTAVTGDTVLFSPGCASFDMFSSYQERGEAFTSLVKSQIGKAA